MSDVRDPAIAARRGPESETRLRGRMGAFELLFTVVAYNGPVVVFLGFMPVAILLGNGAGLPVAILVAGVVVLLVAVGLLRMTAELDRSGGFYALITAGLGRVIGLSSGFIALTCYFVALVGVYALSGIAMDGVVSGLFGGPHVSWAVWAFVVMAITTVLGYVNISFSAKLLTIFLVCELILMVAYDVSVLWQGGADGIGFDSFTPEEVFSGSISIALLFGIGLFGGFEATVVFRDEVKDPVRTTKRATYGVIALLAGIYSLTAWCFVNSYGASAVMSVLNQDLAGASTASIERFTGRFAYDAATVMLFTSSFALVLAAHNITSRYLFNLGADGIFPRALGQAHPRHVSPHRASLVVSAASAVVVLVFFLTRTSEADLYARLAGLYSYSFVMLLVLVALAIGAYLLRTHGAGHRGPGIASLIGFVAFSVVLVLATRNFTLLTGATGAGEGILLGVIWGIAVLGAVLALVYRRRKPVTYASIGRQ